MTVIQRSGSETQAVALNQHSVIWIFTRQQWNLVYRLEQIVEEMEKFFCKTINPSQVTKAPGFLFTRVTTWQRSQNSRGLGRASWELRRNIFCWGKRLQRHHLFLFKYENVPSGCNKTAEIVLHYVCCFFGYSTFFSLAPKKKADQLWETLKQVWDIFWEKN